jgi:YHS domain-containing protein
MQKNGKNRREEAKPTAAQSNAEVKMEEGPTYYLCSELKKE